MIMCAAFLGILWAKFPPKDTGNQRLDVQQQQSGVEQDVVKAE